MATDSYVWLSCGQIIKTLWFTNSWQLWNPGWKSGSISGFIFSRKFISATSFLCTKMGSRKFISSRKWPPRKFISTHLFGLGNSFLPENDLFGNLFLLYFCGKSDFYDENQDDKFLLGNSFLLYFYSGWFSAQKFSLIFSVLKLFIFILLISTSNRVMLYTVLCYSYAINMKNSVNSR